MAAELRLNAAALNGLVKGSAVKAELKLRAEAVLTEAKSNIEAMDAVDTGRMRDSGEVVPEGFGFRIQFPVDYAAIVHEGTGIGRNSHPRPFLALAAGTRRVVGK